MTRAVSGWAIPPGFVVQKDPLVSAVRKAIEDSRATVVSRVILVPEVIPVPVVHKDLRVSPVQLAPVGLQGHRDRKDRKVPAAYPVMTSMCFWIQTPITSQTGSKSWWARTPPMMPVSPLRPIKTVFPTSSVVPPVPMARMARMGQTERQVRKDQRALMAQKSWMSPWMKPVS